MTRFTRTLLSWGIRHSVTRVGRPPTNGKVERFRRTILELYRQRPLLPSKEERQQALKDCLAFYNNLRHHTILGGLTPAQRRDLDIKSHGVLTSS